MVSWPLTSPKPLGASPSLASMMVPALSLPGTMGTLLGGRSPGKTPWDEGRGVACPGEKNEVSLDKSSPPHLLLFSGRDPRHGAPTGTSTGVAPSGLAPSPRGSFQIWEQKRSNTLLFFQTPGGFGRAHFEDGWKQGRAGSTQQWQVQCAGQWVDSHVTGTMSWVPPLPTPQGSPGQPSPSIEPGNVFRSQPGLQHSPRCSASPPQPSQV